MCIRDRAYALGRFTSVRIRTVGPGLRTGFRILADDPTELGSDMVCNVAGALSEFEGPLTIEMCIRDRSGDRCQTGQRDKEEDQGGDQQQSQGRQTAQRLEHGIPHRRGHPVSYTHLWGVLLRNSQHTW